MKIISVNLGVEREIQTTNSTSVKTGIYKSPVADALHVSKLGLDGDVIHSPKSHGGPDQALYVYGAGDYAWWEKELGKEIAPGTFGENLTIEEIESAEFNAGDFLHIGDVILQVTAPRIPCVTFAARMDDPAWVKRFRQAERPGFYCRVMREGSVRSGDVVSLEKYTGATISLIQLYRDYYEKRSEETLRRHLDAPVAIRWRRRMEAELSSLLAT